MEAAGRRRRERRVRAAGPLRAIDYTARGPSFNADALPPGAAEYLTPANPRLHELRAVYAALDVPATRPSLWSASYVARELDLRYFRGDNAFVWQQREGLTPAALPLRTYYAHGVDGLGLLATLEEDELFGVWSLAWDSGRRTSRDLVDAVADHRVPSLMIVPNTGERLVSLEADNRRLDFTPELARHGYREVARRPKYSDPAVQIYGVAPGHHYFLFARG